MSASRPTPGRARVLEFLRAHPDREYTLRQLAGYLHRSERTIQAHLDALLEQDAIHATDPD